VVEVAMAELTAGESGAEVTKTFVRSGQAGVCNMIIKAEYSKAKFANGNDSDED